MPRGNTKERAEVIADDFIKGGMKYARVGRKYTLLGSKGGNTKDSSLATNSGKNLILKNVQVQKALEEILDSKGVNDELITQNFKKVLEEKAQKSPSWSEKHAFIRTYLQVTGRLKESSDTNVNVGLVIKE